MMMTLGVAEFLVIPTVRRPEDSQCCWQKSQRLSGFEECGSKIISVAVLGWLSRQWKSFAAQRALQKQTNLSEPDQ